MGTEKDTTLEAVVLVRAIRLNAVIAGLVTGFMAGFALFAATNWLVLKGGRVVGPHLALLNQFFPGYQVTFVGSLIGGAWAFVVGFVAAFAIVRIYNVMMGLRRSEGGRRP
ncbi:MAG TPA: hypothetical protein VKV41_09840 [Methylomirabilota bacterium]|jgi:hypothetical protein|nr:hypothetical protein [Methylomirabilota bacterium]